MKADVEFRSRRELDTADLDNKRGTRKITVTVERVNDIVNQRQGYIVTCSVRVRIEGLRLHVNSTAPSSFSDYPALIETEVSAKTFDRTIIACDLLHYAPKTLNSSTQMTRTGGSNQGTTVERQHTVGSALSTTNSFGANIQLGFQGEMPTGDIGANYQHTMTSESSTSDLQGVTQNASVDASASTTVSIMDWAAYAKVLEYDQSVSWWWGQESPWNVIRYHDKITGSDTSIALPKHVRDQLFDEGVLLPPSELAMFGPDFSSKARWLFTARNGKYFDTALALHCDPVVYVGTHSVPPVTEDDPDTITGVTASLSVTSKGFDKDRPCKIDSLAKLALTPLSTGTTFTGTINFRVNPSFSSPLCPDTLARAFVSVSNEVMAVVSAEFGADMSVTLDKTTTASVTLYFKVDDRNEHVNLALKCWKDGTSNVGVGITIRPDRPSGPTDVVPTDERKLHRHVDWSKGDGTANSLLTVDLRNRDYFSDECCDFLVAGGNVVELLFTSTTGEPVTLCLPTIAVG